MFLSFHHLDLFVTALDASHSVKHLILIKPGCAGLQFLGNARFALKQFAAVNIMFTLHVVHTTQGTQRELLPQTDFKDWFREPKKVLGRSSKFSHSSKQKENWCIFLGNTIRAEVVMMQQLTLEVKEGSESKRLYEREFACRVVPELAKPQQNSREQRGSCPIHHPLYCSGTFLLGHGRIHKQTERLWDTWINKVYFIHAIAARIPMSLSQPHIFVPFLLHSAPLPFCFMLYLPAVFILSHCLLSAFFCSIPMSPERLAQVSVWCHLLTDFPCVPLRTADSQQGHFFPQEWGGASFAVSPLSILCKASST